MVVVGYVTAFSSGTTSSAIASPIGESPSEVEVPTKKETVGIVSEGNLDHHGEG